MSGLINNGLPIIGNFVGTELFNLDTGYTQGINPESAATNLMQLSAAIKQFNDTSSKTMVAGTRYYSSWTVGNSFQATGISARVGGTGGTDLWIFELHDSTGALVATTSLSGVTAGTANTFQRIAFTAPVVVTPGTYYLAVQSNGTSATLGTYSSAGLPITDGSATGVFGTSASITPPTTYTANLGPLATLY